jgi:glutathione S-transferase
VKLLSDATTPFGRKVLVAALERSISIEEVFVALDGTGPLDGYNPLRQIPTLVTDDGRAIYDSDVIMQYLDTCHSGEALVPDSDRFGVLTRMALGSGLIEATLLRRMEVVREAGERSARFIVKMEERIARALAALEMQSDTLAGAGVLRADQITAACALGYVDFRYTDAWRERHPWLAGWFAAIAGRPSMVATAPTRAHPIGSQPSGSQ